MSQRCYELSDFEWMIIQPLLPNKPGGVAEGAQQHPLAV